MSEQLMKRDKHEAWPSSSCWYWKGDVLRAPTLEAMRSDIDVLAMRDPNYWVAIGRGECDGATQRFRVGDEPRCIAERAVCEVYERVMRKFLQEKKIEVTGVEYWAQVYTPGAGLAFHFDKDEELLIQTGRIEHPIFSSVLYLHSSDDDDDDATAVTRTRSLGMLSTSRLGATLVMDQRHDDDPEQAVTSSVLCYPRSGALFVFDGALAHGVLESAKQGRRKTLLMNWWARRPCNVESIDADAMEGMARIVRNDALDVAVPANSDDDDDEKAVHVLRSAQRVDIIPIDVDARDDVVALEDVLPSAGVVADVIACRHEGAQLLQIEDPAGAVVFVPDSMCSE